MTPAGVLADLFSALFVDARELNGWLQRHPWGHVVVGVPSPTASLREASHEAANQIVARGLMDVVLASLGASFPLRHGEIERIAAVLPQPRAGDQIRATGEDSQEYTVSRDWRPSFVGSAFASASYASQPLRAWTPQIRRLLAEAKEHVWTQNVDSLKIVIGRIRAEATAVRDTPHLLDTDPAIPTRVEFLATLDLARIAAAQLRYAESRHHLHEALREANALAASERERLTGALRITLTDLLDEPPPKDADLWAWARENVPHP